MQAHSVGFKQNSNEAIWSLFTGVQALENAFPEREATQTMLPADLNHVVISTKFA